MRLVICFVIWVDFEQCVETLILSLVVALTQKEHACLECT